MRAQGKPHRAQSVRESGSTGSKRAIPSRYRRKIVLIPFWSSCSRDLASTSYGRTTGLSRMLVCIGGARRSHGLAPQMLIHYGIYHFGAKRSAFRNDFCVRCDGERLAIHTSTLDVLHVYWSRSFRSVASDVGIVSTAGTRSTAFEPPGARSKCSSPSSSRLLP
jgi:hypothetical protein